ncbi:outer membrane beta-barrel protein [Rubrivirga sp.]|uniref:outer membrane beta-barrel protein n=1 Tax=Rubrivirga sp. TaxID=1885344 RepID=UPI003B51C095
MRTLLPLLAFVAAPLAAQPVGPSNTEGLFLQLALDGQSLNYDEDDFDDTDDGGGAALRVGYGISPVVTFYVGASGAEIDGQTNGVINNTYRFGAGELGARFNLNRGSALRPYLDVALRGVVASDDASDLEFQGGGIAFGGGVAYFVSPTIAFDAALRLGGGQFTEVDLGRIALDIEDRDIGYGEGRLSVGVTAYPFR